MLRAEKRGNQRRRLKRAWPQRPNGKRPERAVVQSTPLINIGNTEGAKDLNSYTASVYRKSTADEINGHLPANAIMRQTVYIGGSKLRYVMDYLPTVTNAELVDMEDGDSGDPIYVRTSKSEAETVSYTGDPTIDTDTDGKKTYKYMGGTYVPSKLKSINKSQWEDYGNAQGATSVIKRLVSVGKAVSRPANPTKAKVPSGYRYQKYLPVSDTWIDVTIPSNWYDCTTWEYYYPYPEYDYLGYFASSGDPGGGGSVTVTPYTPEIVRAQKIKQGELVTSGITTQRYDYFTYIPSAAENVTKTFLVQGASTAVQNFAFDGMDDVYDE